MYRELFTIIVCIRFDFFNIKSGGGGGVNFVYVLRCGLSQVSIISSDSTFTMYNNNFLPPPHDRGDHLFFNNIICDGYTSLGKYKYCIHDGAGVINLKIRDAWIGFFSKKICRSRCDFILLLFVVWP